MCTSRMCFSTYGRQAPPPAGFRLACRGPRFVAVAWHRTCSIPEVCLRCPYCYTPTTVTRVSQRHQGDMRTASATGAMGTGRCLHGQAPSPRWSQVLSDSPLLGTAIPLDSQLDVWGASGPPGVQSPIGEKREPMRKHTASFPHLCRGRRAASSPRTELPNRNAQSRGQPKDLGAAGCGGFVLICLPTRPASPWGWRALRTGNTARTQTNSPVHPGTF